MKKNNNHLKFKILKIFFSFHSQAYYSAFYFPGASADSIELLAPNTKGVSTDDGHESDQIFEFDGVSSAVSVSNEVLNHGLAPIFTIATWLKHKNHPNQDKHVKEHILCSADDHSKF